MDSNVFRPIKTAWPIVIALNHFCSPGSRHGILLFFPITRFRVIATIAVITGFNLWRRLFTVHSSQFGVRGSEFRFLSSVLRFLHLCQSVKSVAPLVHRSAFGVLGGL